MEKECCGKHIGFVGNIGLMGKVFCGKHRLNGKRVV
jgi:hypothetical protein